MEFGSTKFRSAWAVLGSLHRTHGSSLNDEALDTLMIQVEVIVNSRLLKIPLTIETIADGTSEAATSLSNLLTIKSKVVMPPPRSLGTPDLYSRRWRRIQHIANEFWR